MWSLLKEFPPYLMNVGRNNRGSYYITVTNFRKSWLYSPPRENLLRIMKKSNDGIEFDDENELLKRALDMMCHPHTAQEISVSEDEGGDCLSVSIKKEYEIVLKLEIDLFLEASEDYHYKEVIQPLLKTICDLRSSQLELREALKKKDREIEEYKIEGRAPRRLITTVYDDEAHMKKHNAYEQVLGTTNGVQLLSHFLDQNQIDIKPISPTEIVQFSTDQPSPVTNGRESEREIKTEVESSQDLFNDNSVSNINVDHTEISDSIVQRVSIKTEDTTISDSMIKPVHSITENKEVSIGSVIQTNASSSTDVKPPTPVPRKRLKNRLNY